MEIIRWKDNAVEITPQAYSIKVFRDIWNADKTKLKDKAVFDLTMLYFMYDPRSDYQIYINEEERNEIIKQHMGIPNWKASKLFIEAIPVYEELTTTTASMVIKNNRILLDEVIKFATNLKLDSTTNMDEKGRPIYKMADITKTIKDSNDLVAKILETEKLVNQQIEEQSSKMRGSGERSIGDNGFSFMD